jgi:hypothetical protein
MIRPAEQASVWSSTFARKSAQRGGDRVSAVSGGLRFGNAQGEIEHAFEFPCAVGEAIVARSHVIASAEVFVGDIEACEDRDFETVSLRTLPHGEAHLLIHVRRQFRDVRLVERTSYGIALTVDLDVHYAGFCHNEVVGR